MPETSRRLLLFVTDLEIGGTPTVVRELAARLPMQDLAVEVACLGRFGPVAEQIRADGAEVTAFDAQARQLPAAVRRLRELVREREIDVVLSFLVHANTVAALAARSLPRVRWFQSIQTTQPSPRWHWPVQAVAARRARRVICPSASVAQAARRRAWVKPEKLVVIPNAVDASLLAAEPVTRVGGGGGGGGPFRVGFIGRLDRVKRVESLVHAMRGVKEAHLHIYGDGPDRLRLESVAGAFIGKSIHFHGFVPRERALGEIDLLVLPSLAEGMPMVLIEAMAAGVPTLGTDVPGIRDVIRHDKTGLLVPGRGGGGGGSGRHPLLDVSLEQALATAIERLRTDQDLCHCLASNALKEVRREYTWETVIPQYLRELT